jgi:hypothetical protein
MASYSSKRRQNLSHCTLAKGGRQRRVVGSAGECHDKASSQTKGSRGWFDMVPGFLGLHVWHPLLPFTGTHSTLPFFQMHRYTLLSLWYAGTTAAAYNTTSSPPLQTGTSLEIIKLERDTNLHAGTTKAGSVSIVRPWFISTVVRFRRPSFHKKHWPYPYYTHNQYLCCRSICAHRNVATRMTCNQRGAFGCNVVAFCSACC